MEFQQLDGCQCAGSCPQVIARVTHIAHGQLQKCWHVNVHVRLPIIVRMGIKISAEAWEGLVAYMWDDSLVVGVVAVLDDSLAQASVGVDDWPGETPARVGLPPPHQHSC